MQHLHITDLFKHVAGGQQKQLSKRNRAMQLPEDGFLEQLLARCRREKDVALLKQVLGDPYFPLGMLERTIFADVTGMRFFINKSRPDLEPALAKELLDWATAFFRVRHDIQTFFDPATITCIPVDGLRHRLPLGQWCTLCGLCCQIGGVPPNPPPEIRYPDHWYLFLAGQAVENQQLCPFLFQYFGEPFYFCAIHHIKPIACRQFDRENCRERLAERNLHA